MGWAATWPRRPRVPNAHRRAGVCHSGAFAVRHRLLLDPNPTRDQLQELPTEQDRETLQDKRKLALADCVCFVYDSSDPNSFTYIVNLMVRPRCRPRPNRPRGARAGH